MSFYALQITYLEKGLYTGVCFLCVYIIEAVRSSRIQSAQPFLGRSCQNKLMRSNNFEVNVTVTMCIEVEAQAKNYYACEPIFKFFSHSQQA